MRQEQERFRSHLLNRGVDTNLPGRWDSIDTSGVYYPSEDIKQERIREVRFNLNQEDNKEEEEEVPHKTEFQKTDGFEPFVGKEPQEGQENHLFVNLYGGSYSQRMELNRVGVERALQIAHLEGKVFLSTLAPYRSRGEAQGNELVAKRFLFFGEKIQKAEEENPYKRVVSVPEGWRIEINDQRITEELTEKRLGGERLQKAFINRFNGQLKNALRECVWREKCSSEKDQHFRLKLVGSMLFPTLLSLVEIPVFLTSPSLVNALDYGWVFVGYGIVNFLARPARRNFRAFEKRAKEINPNFKLPAHQYRKIDGKWEYFMPQIEIDKVGRTYVYLAGKGRRLVRDIEEEK